MKSVRVDEVIHDLNKLKDRYEELKDLIADQVRDNEIADAKSNIVDLQDLAISIKHMGNLKVQMPTKDKQLTVSDIEYKIQERMEKLGNQFGSEHRLNELNRLQGWLLCGDDY
jgi:hypothetical protein